MKRATLIALFFILCVSVVWAQDAPIFYAITEENVDKVKALIFDGADVNIINSAGLTALQIAARYSGNLELYRVLLAAGAQVNPDENGIYETLFELILARGDVEIVKLFLDAGVNIHRNTLYGQTPLEYAVGRQIDPEIFRLLIQNGASVTEGGEGSTPIHSAAHSSKAENIALLVEFGADVNARDSYGYTPLMTASYIYESVEALLNYGAEIDAKNDKGQTALMLSAQNGADPEVIRLFLQRGADAKLEDNTGKTALDYFDQNRRLSNSPVRKELKDRS